jgi:hypothetical protein
MKDARDPGTIDMTLAPKRGRGRPSTGKAKSAAERMREYRSRSVTVNRVVLESALVQSSQVEAIDFQVDGMDQVEAENRRLRGLLADVSLSLRDVKHLLVQAYGVNAGRAAMWKSDVNSAAWKVQFAIDLCNVTKKKGAK